MLFFVTYLIKMILLTAALSFYMYAATCTGFVPNAIGTKLWMLVHRTTAIILRALNGPVAKIGMEESNGNE